MNFISRSPRAIARRILPERMRGCVSAVFTYCRRMNSCLRVLRVVRGHRPADSAVLWRSLLVAPIEMLRDLHTWREPYLTGDAEIRIADLGTFAVRARSDDLGHLLPDTRAGILRAIAQNIRPGDFVIDAGANIGAVTVFLAQRVGSQGRVRAVEMMPDTAAQLRRNIDLNGLACVDVIEAALSSRAGDMVDAVVPDDLHGQASIARDFSRGVPLRRVQVGTTTLDLLTSDLGEIALIKMDLEGAEFLALTGAERTLERTRSIVFESWDSDGGKAGALLSRAGFVVSAIDERNFLARRRDEREVRC